MTLLFLKKSIIFLLSVFLAADLLVAFPRDARASSSPAALFLNPGSGSFLVGSTFDLSVVLDTKGSAINTVEVELLFPPDILQIASPSVGRSLVQVWPSPPIFSNPEGRIYFVGGIPSPGLATSQGILLTLTFRVVGPGEGFVRFGDTTSILANDGKGTNVLGQKGIASFHASVAPPHGPVISSPTHPDQERWYRDPNPLFIWEKSPFGQEYSYEINQDPGGFPDTIVENRSSMASFAGLASGIGYFHLRERAAGVWGGVSHFVVKIDRDPPAEFSAAVSPGSRTTSHSPVFRFFTTDALSGVDRFEIKVVPLSGDAASEALFFEAVSPYQAFNLKPGRYQVVVRAYDGAGNVRDAPATITVLRSFGQYLNPEGADLGFVFLSWSLLLVVTASLLIIVLLLLAAFWIKHRRYLMRFMKEDFATSARRLAKRPSTLILAVLFGASLLLLPAAAHGRVSDAPPAPVISVAPMQYYPLDESLYIEGGSAPGAPVEIVFELVGGSVGHVRRRVTANSLGEWQLNEQLRLPSGEWMARARVASDPPSDWSLPRTIRSAVSGFVIAGITVHFLPAVLALACLFFIAGILLIWSVVRVRRIVREEHEHALAERTTALERALKEKERREKADVVEREFSEIRRKVAEELEHYDTHDAGGRIPSAHEETHRARLLRDLRQAEETIEEKITEQS